MIFSGSDVDELWLQPNSFTGMTYSHETIDPILNIIYYPVTTRLLTRTRTILPNSTLIITHDASTHALTLL